MILLIEVSISVTARPHFYQTPTVSRSIESTPVLERKYFKSTTNESPKSTMPGNNERQQHLPTNSGKKLSVQQQNEIKLKLTSGTRQLRDHELSYFGVGGGGGSGSPNRKTSSSSSTSSFSNFYPKQLSASFNEKHSNTSLYRNSSKEPIRISPAPIKVKPHVFEESRKYSERPDLLQHSPNVEKKLVSSPVPVVKSVQANPVSIQTEPIYENLKDVNYLTQQQRMKLKRDEELLEELAKDADEILNVS